jgi:hypothetical protein
MSTVIYYRAGGVMEQEELAAAKRHFTVVGSRLSIQAGQLVIGRYSVLPFYRDLEQDVLTLEARLINSYSQHLYVADLQNWVADLGDMTPATWSSLEDIPEEGPFVLKGATNSKKFQWKTHMYAEDRREACEVYARLCEDGLISEQRIYIRKYVPLFTYFPDVIGLPVTKEFRFFVYDGEILCGGYYWSSHVDTLLESGIELPKVEEVPRAFLEKVTGRIGRKVMFYALDVAQTLSGDWIVIELNDGQMSGLSMNDPDELYERLAARMK